LRALATGGNTQSNRDQWPDRLDIPSSLQKTLEPRLSVPERSMAVKCSICAAFQVLSSNRQFFRPEEGSTAMGPASARMFSNEIDKDAFGLLSQSRNSAIDSGCACSTTLMMSWRQAGIFMPSILRDGEDSFPVQAERWTLELYVAARKDAVWRSPHSDASNRSFDRSA